MLPKPKRLSQSPAYHRSRKQEEAVATKYGGRRVPGSGSGDMKGDDRIDDIARIECKTTQAKSYRVTLEDLAKIESAAISAGEVPIMEIEFLDARGKPIRSIGVMPTWALEKLIDNAKS